MTASTALDARNALATCCVAGKIGEDAPDADEPDERDDDAEEEAERRPATGGDRRVALGEPALVAVEREPQRVADDDEDDDPDRRRDERLDDVAVHAGKFGAPRDEPASAVGARCISPLLAGENAGLGRRVLLVRQLAARVQVGERGEACRQVGRRSGGGGGAVGVGAAGSRRAALPPVRHARPARRRRTTGHRASGNSCSVCLRVSSIQVAPSATRIATTSSRVKSVTVGGQQQEQPDDRRADVRPARDCGAPARASRARSARAGPGPRARRRRGRGARRRSSAGTSRA